MLTVHHLENSRSQRILWLLEELEAEYEVKRYERESSGLAPEALTEVHPLGKSPVITHDSVTVAESGAIIEYLIDHFGDGHLLPPEGSKERLAYTFWLHYAEGSVMPLMIIALILGRIESAPMPFFIKPIARGITGKVRSSYLDQNLVRHLSFMNQSLDEQPWFCGKDFSAADVQMGFPLEAAEVRTDLRQHYPNLASFLDRIRERPAYQRALEAGGPYSLG